MEADDRDRVRIERESVRLKHKDEMKATKVTINEPMQNNTEEERLETGVTISGPTTPECAAQHKDAEEDDVDDDMPRDIHYSPRVH